MCIWRWYPHVSVCVWMCTVIIVKITGISTILFLFQDLLTLNEDGFHKLQQVIDTSNLVTPNTSASGKDVISEDVLKLKQTWDEIIRQLKESREKLDDAVRQWELYEEAVKTLSKWMTDIENAVKLEMGLQGTLSEKRNQAEKMKVNVLT